MAKVLIVDDNFLENRGMVSALEALGHEPVGVHTLKQGLDAAWDGKWDLVLLDTTLPDGDGVDKIEAFMEASEGAPLVMAVREEEMDRVKGVKDIKGLVTKPLKVKDFSATVNKALGKKATTAVEEPAPAPKKAKGGKGKVKASAGDVLPDPLPPLKDFKEAQEIRYLKRLIELSENDVKKAMAMSKVSRAGYYNMLKKYDLTNYWKDQGGK